MHPAVFLDRDGTINEEMGYINHLSRFRLLPGSAEAIARLNRAGLKVVVVTNQSGVARGYFPLSLLEEVHRLMLAQFHQAGARVDGIYVCTHAPDAGCSCRKPRPGLILQAARELDLDVGRSFVVGDRFNDLETAANAGAQGILVKSGYGRGELEYSPAAGRLTPAHVAEDLLAAADWIIGQRYYSGYKID